MDANKEKAVKAKALAEKKFKESDVIGAKKIAIKALNMCPNLEGLREFLATLEIHISNQKVLSGESDWYGVLGVKPSADAATIWEHYRKLSFLFHPVKNKSVGAEGAYQILCSAWSRISNKIIASLSRRTFWTVCNDCQMKFEYSRECLNKRLFCQNCFQFFLASDISGSSNGYASSSNGYAPKTNDSSNGHAPKWRKPLSNGSVKAVGSSSTGYATSIQIKSATKFVIKKRALMGPQDDILLKDLIRKKPAAAKSAKAKKGEECCTTATWKVERPSKEIRNMLISKARKEIKLKVKEWGKLEAPQKNIFLSMSVPDSDFHNFDNDRVEASFEKDQFWALYDDDDGMPRYYALIHSVISRNPFVLKISWLSCKTNLEFGLQPWVGSGFRKTCGEFSVGKPAITTSLSSFSHRVEFTRGARGAASMHPKTGQVWAVYRNWSAGWNQFTPEDVVNKYEMVEILEDYEERKGVRVVKLVKVCGFQAVFKRGDETTTFPKEEIFRLSHQVPFWCLTKKETLVGDLHGCVELDPASLPLDLLQLVGRKGILGTRDGEVKVYKRRKL